MWRCGGLGLGFSGARNDVCHFDLELYLGEALERLYEIYLLVVDHWRFSNRKSF